MSKRITDLNPTLKRFFINFICVFWAGFLFIFAGHISAQTTVRPFDWEQIIPLVTKKIEVENILGKPFFEDRYVSAYNLEKGKITVWYYGTRKPDTSEYRCNISLDTVSSFSISLLDRINVSALEFDLRKFKKEEGHTSERRYTDDENGISFDVDQTEDGLEWVKSFDYYGSRSKVKTLCSREQK